MKKSAFVLALIALFVLAPLTGVIFGKPDSPLQSPPDEYAILTYMPYSATPYAIQGERYSVKIFYGDKPFELVKFTKDELEEKGLMALVAKLLGRLSTEGYTLVSTNVLNSSTSTSTEVHCFLKRTK